MNKNLILKTNKIKNIYIFIIKNKLRYNSYYFYKIIINIRISKYLIISFS
jgi:hypothetical protein